MAKTKPTKTRTALLQPLTVVEMDTLLKLNKAIASTKDKVELLKVINDEVKSIMPFYGPGLFIVNEKENYHYDLTVVHPEINNDDINNIAASTIEERIPHKGTAIEEVMRCNKAKLWNWKKDLIDKGFDHPYFPFMLQHKTFFAIACPLKVRGKTIGFFSVSSIEDIYSEKQLPFFAAITDTLAIAVSNILVNEEVAEREKEKTILLSISESIAIVKDKKQLLKLVFEKVQPLFNFYDAGFFIIDKNREFVNDWTVSIPEISPSEANFKINDIDAGKFLFKDSAIEWTYQQLKQDKSPQVFNYTKEVFAQFPDYAQFQVMKEIGYKQSLGTLLRTGEEELGILFFNSLNENHFNQKQYSLFQGIADQLAIAVQNIQANEEILSREHEKTQLLKISEAIASIQDYKELLKVIYEVIQPIFPFDNTGIFIADSKTEKIFEITDAKILESTTVEKFLKVKTLGPFTLKDFEPQSWYHSTTTIITTPAEQIGFINSEICKEQLNVSIQSGMQEMICGPLINRGKKIGSIYLSTKQKGLYSPKIENIFKSVSDFISIAVANILANEEILEREKEKTLLLNISNAVSKIEHKLDLLKIIDNLLIPVFHQNGAGFSVANNTKTYFVDYYDKYASKVTENNDSIALSKAIAESVFTDNDFSIPLKDSLVEYYMQQPPSTGKLEDVLPLNLNSDLIRLEIEHGLYHYMCAPLVAAGKTFGLFNLLFKEKNKPSPLSLNLFTQITEILAIAFANYQANDEIREREKEKDILLNVSQKLSNAKKMDELLQIILEEVKPILDFYDAGILLIDKQTNSFYDVNVIHPKIDNSEVNHFLNQKNYYKDNFLSLKNSVMEWLIKKYAAEKYFLFDYSADYSAFSHGELMKDLQTGGYVESWGCLLQQQGETIGMLTLNYKEKNKAPLQKLSLFLALAERIGSSVVNILASEEIAALNKQLFAQNEYLIEEVEQVYNFEEMIGQNQKFKDACKNIGLVAKTDSSVLILGETGTGKELVARAIHNYSPRKNKPLIKLNCAALPANLIESELFGHERGAFTGAIERRIGKFELANGSTLFLDEIGELPLELQAKLLRALQEKEVERLGSNKVIPIDVRIIAATNRDLIKDVQTGKFRQDLYYRLHIFPITLPPLRERKEDIPLLAAHFIQKYAKKMGKNIQGLSHKALEEMMGYNWPGNIRELEHVIERSTIIAKSKLLQDLDLPLSSKNKIQVTPNEFVIKTWQEQERDYILEVLKMTGGNLGGKGGAAELLQLPATTLQSKMNKLGIKRKHFVEK